MQLRSLADQLVRDLKASWQKTAILGVLLVIGLVLWIPPLVRAVVSGAAPSATISVAPSLSTGATIQRGTPIRLQQTNTQASTKFNSPSGPTWDEFDERARSDRLIRSADVAQIPGDAFQMNHDQFSPPVLFAKEPKKKAKLATVTKTAATTSILDELRLKSTVIGKNRRAALINRKLYFEGMSIQTTDGESFLLESIFERKVVLKRGGQRFELKIAKRSSAAK